MSFELLETWLAWPGMQALGWSLIHFVWQGALVALVLAAILTRLKESQPGLRYLAACASLLVMTALPVVTMYWTWPASAATPVAGGSLEVLPNSSLPIQAEGSAPKPTSATDAPATTPVLRDGPEPSPTAATGTGTAPVSEVRWPRSWLSWCVALWLVGVAGLTVRLCAGWLWTQRLRTHAVQSLGAEWEASLGRLADQLQVTRPVRLLQSALVEVPVVLGWLRPVILLPASTLAYLPIKHLEAILAHELAHVRRYDYLVNLVQTTLETLLFYHPATWWVSRVIRTEREACCDELAAETCGGRLEYAKALASLEEARQRSPQFAMAATGGPLVNRIRRLLGLPTVQANRSAWWVMAALAASVVVVLATNGGADRRATAAGQPPTRDGERWGLESNGLRCRLVTLAADANDEAPDLSKTTTTYNRGSDVTLGVELKNVGGKPLTLLGVRYGDSYGGASGKLSTGFFGPYLFELEFTDKAGKPIPRPARTFLEGMLELSGASTHEVEPGKSLVVALRPSKFNAPMHYQLPAGEYLARVVYRGLSDGVRAQIAKHWPDKPHAKSWSGTATSNQASFSITPDPKAAKAVEPSWGQPHNGLSAAIKFQRRDNQSNNDPAGTFPLNSALDVTFLVKNVSDKPITLVSETWRQDDRVQVKNAAGEQQEVGGSWYSGWPIQVRWTLRPGEIAELQAATFGIAATDAALKEFEHPIGKTLLAKPGTYRFQYVLRFGGLQTKDDQGNVIVPAKDDWQGEVSTGELALTFRERTAEDDKRDKADNFVGQVEFVDPDGKPIKQGTFTAYLTTGQKQPAVLQIKGGATPVPDCTAKPMSINVRAPGYEEALLYDVAFKPNEVKRLTLQPATPAQLRLISSVDDRPLAGAKVRYFNKTSDLASGGPYPTQGIEGPVWATSDAQGVAMLDSLQKINPHYAKLGDAVYFFYVEAPGFAGQFVGPIKAGMTVAMKLTPPLEVRGEVLGTAEELDRFAAEWDQPFNMKTATPAAAFDYAISQQLTTKREGNKLTFHLTGLSPGRLRIVMNFGPPPHNVSHVFGRRDPKGTDVVLDVELKESTTNVILKNPK